jgi:hypothetical protein
MVILEKNRKEREEDIRGTKRIAFIFCKENILFF